MYRLVIVDGYGTEFTSGARSAKEMSRIMDVHFDDWTRVETHDLMSDSWLLLEDHSCFDAL